MTTIEEMIKNSSCFGVAFDGKVRECKICEVRMKCESKCRMGLSSVVSNPSDIIDIEPTEEDKVEVTSSNTKPEAVELADKDEISMDEDTLEKVQKEKAKKPAKVKKPVAAVEYDESMPEFKPMSIEELEALLVERGGDAAEFEKYTNPSIKKMRLTMALKKTYVK